MSEDQQKEFREQPDLLNNFAFKLPDDHYARIPGKPKIRPGYSRVGIFENGSLDRKTREFTTNIKEHSELFLNQTYRDFFLTIDNLIVELGLKEKIDTYTQNFWARESERQAEVKATNEALRNPDLSKEQRRELLIKGAKHGEWRIDLNEIARPVYEKMLEMGYTHYDITF